MKKFTIRIVAALVAVVALGMSVGCSANQQAEAKTAVARIASYEPEVQTAVDTVASVLETLLPGEASLIQSAQAAFDADMQVLVATVDAYTKTPNTGTFNAIASALNTVLADNQAQFLAAAKISNPASVATAKTAIAGVRVILLLMDGALQTAQPHAQVVATAQARTLKLKELEPYITPSEKVEIAQQTGQKFETVWAYETAQGF